MQKHNKESHSFKRSVNKYTGLSFEKFRRLYSVGNVDYTCPEYGDIAQIYNSPDQNWDWRTQNVNSSIQEQGFQGGASAYAAVSAIEHHHQITYKIQKEFSPQQVLDCISMDTFTPNDAFQYIKNTGGLSTLKDYPSTVSKGNCYFNYSQDGIQIIGTNGSMRVPQYDEYTLQAAVRFKGPVTAMFQASSDFLSYSSGIYSSNSCGVNSTFNHALLIIGYGIENGQNYWLVQNSWGSSWGQNGYGKISRGNNMCNISACASYPSYITDPEQSPIRNYQFYKHDLATGARCLDGTQSGIFYSKGFGDGKNKSIVHFMGGSWCLGRNSSTFESDCLKRAIGVLGSSAYWPDQFEYGEFFLPGDPQKTTNFYNWNRFIVFYCDGTGHQGYKKDPVSVQGMNLYFRGHNNTLEALKQVLIKLPALQTDTFIMTGCSAGSQSVYTWLQYFKDTITAINPNTKVIGLPDSGFFIDYQSLATGDNDYSLKMKTLVDYVNQEVPLPNSNCANANKENPHYCILAEHLVNYTDAPIFIEQSLYDWWQLQNILAVKCFFTNDSQTVPDINSCNATELQLINTFRNYSSTLFKQTSSAFENRGVWSPACEFHCNINYGIDDASMLMQVPMNSGNTLGTSIKQFLSGVKGTENWQWVDSVDWPNNTPCSGKKSATSCSTSRIFLSE